MSAKRGASASEDNARAAISILKKIAETGAKEAAVDVDSYLSRLESESETIDEELAHVVDAHERALAEWEEHYRAETGADLARLQVDIGSKDAKIKDIQSKFGFVLGTITAPLPAEAT